MKSRLIFFLVASLCLSCSDNKPLSDVEKQQITGEVKEVVAQLISAAEKADFDAIVKLFYDTPDNKILTPDGQVVSFSDWTATLRTIFDTFQSQKINTISDNYLVLDKTTVWYTNVSKTQVNLKDSSVIMQNPWSMFCLLKKIDNEWKFAGLTEHGNEQITRPAPLPKDLDQVELSKQMLGMWRCEFGDTVQIYNQQPFGNSQVVTVTTTVKGKPFREGRQLFGFDRLHNRLTFMDADKRGAGVVSMKFNSPNTYTTLPYANISNPAYAPFRIEGEFINPDTYVEKVIVNNETLGTYTTKRIR